MSVPFEYGMLRQALLRRSPGVYLLEIQAPLEMYLEKGASLEQAREMYQRAVREVGFGDEPAWEDVLNGREGFAGPLEIPPDASGPGSGIE